ncbi:nuclear factor of activated T-cells, cytoplasmic 1 [Oryzias melastigma]|uniref:nuclear factor of activated T-cells, cytoplasmic 1 n=1 Tax=Oryzias melastigma TaxID=30732 RepID=UPI000CF803F0|nr:nuclear factor of activated T-cells, cytoplasmic 1 [Oryzias melastigma]
MDVWESLSLLTLIPTIKTEPHDNFSAPLMCTQQGSSKPFYALTSTSPDPRSCVVGGAYPVSQQRPTPKSPSLPFSGSQSPSPKLFELSSSPYSKCFSAAPSVQTSGSPAPHVSIIQETSVHHHPPNLYPPNSSPPASQPSPPNDTPFSQNPGVTPSQPDSSGSSIQEVPRKEVLSSVQKEGSPERMTVSIKKEPQELDQIYLDDVNEIIRNDLSAVSVQSQT